MNRYPFPLCIQLTPPENLYEDKPFADILSLLQQLGFYGVELNLVDFSQPERLKAFLEGFGLRLTMVATGFYATRKGLCLSGEEPVRQQTIQEMKQILSFASACQAGVICGFIKGSAGQNREEAAAQMTKSLAELSQLADPLEVDVYLEATNHYEATLVNTLQEGHGFASTAGSRIRVLPDTYHMNIEEADASAALVRYRELYRNLHVSDNNRFFPSFGAIDFFPVCALLKSLDYTGTISIEGRIHDSLAEDIAASAAYLEEVARRLERI